MNIPDNFVTIDNIPCFAPDKAQMNDGFSSEIHEKLAQAEQYSFWFKSRNHLIISQIKKHFLGMETFCEIGCGNAYVLSGIHQKIPSLSLWGSEIYLNPLKTAQKRLPEISFFQADVCHFPYKNKFDIVGAFDVIEHIDDDVLALQQIYSSLRPGGGIILTVPQHKWLWSRHDDWACHRRRYSRKDMKAKLESAGFELVWHSSFMTFLLPLMYMSRLRSRKKRITVDSIFRELNMNPVLNYCFGKVCALERLFLTIGFTFPVGGSLMCIARKKA